MLNDPRNILVTADSGFALGRVIVDQAELLTIAVELSERRKGLARRLLADLERVAITRGATRCFLEVAADNQAATALYRSAGYREVGRRSGYYRTAGNGAIDAMVLARDLL